MTRNLLVIAALSSFLCACSTMPGPGKMEPLEAVKTCVDDKYRVFWGPDGHIYTALEITKKAHYTDTRQLTLAYYSQYSDLDLNYEAVVTSIKYLLLPWEWGWRNDVTGALHSLHGGDRHKIDERRQTIKDAIMVTIKNPDLDWLSGLLIHAYGDSFAHTKNSYNAPDEKAYNVWFGHLIPSILGHNPDNIKHNQTKYMAYITELYNAIKVDTSGDSNLDEFKEFIKELKCENGACSDFHTLSNKKPIKNSRIDIFSTCMSNNSRRLKESEVQQAIDMIKGHN